MKNQQLQSQATTENSPGVLVNLFLSSFIGLLGLGVILIEDVTKLSCQRNSSNAGYCQIIEVKLLNQSTKQEVLLHEIKDVIHKTSIDSEGFNLLITQTNEEIRLNGFNPTQAEIIQSFLKDANQKDLMIEQAYDRRPYAAFVGGVFLLVGTSGIFEAMRKVARNQ